MQNSAIELIKEVVHKPLKYDDYDQTMVCNETNCYSHAIGSTITRDKSLYRLGIMSKQRRVTDRILSIKDAEEFFIKDMEVINLGIEKLDIDKNKLIGNERLYLKNNQHIVVLFVQQYRETDPIYEFHFIRYDLNKGWTEKRWGRKPCEINPNIGWPNYWPYAQVGIFRVTR